MKKQTTIITSIIVALVLVIGGISYYLLSNVSNVSSEDTTPPPSSRINEVIVPKEPLPIREATQDVILAGKIEVAKEKITTKTQPTQTPTKSTWKLLDTDLDNHHFEYANVWFSREDKQSVFIYFVTYGECDSCFDYSTNYLQVDKASGIISKLNFDYSNNPIFDKTVNKSTLLFNNDKTKFTFVIVHPTNKKQSVYVFDVLKGTTSLVTVLEKEDGVAELGLGYYIPEHKNLWWKNNNTLNINNREFTNL